MLPWRLQRSSIDRSRLAVDRDLPGLAGSFTVTSSERSHDVAKLCSRSPPTLSKSTRSGFHLRHERVTKRMTIL